MKILASALSLACLIGTTGLAAAQATDTDYLSQNRAAVRNYYGASHNGVEANGRCNGVSYGTGARSCGTATGGPVGGINSRN